MLNDSDHRSLAQQLDLFHFQEEAPGMVFWHPPGFLVYRLLEEAARRQVAAQGYAEVRTPQVLRRAIWEASGHWQHFRQNMFCVDDQACEAAIKPVSCPGHIQILKQRVVSYRDLPVRLAEFGLVHRDEQSGALHGLLRLRQFTQDDGQIFCAEDQARAEVVRFCGGVQPFYAAFGFGRVQVVLSTRPAERAGDDAAWDRAETVLSDALQELELPHTVQPGGGAFYGPKIEFVLEDRLGRKWQCGTIQFDLVMPDQFELRFVDSDGKRQPVALLHRALYGSIERFLGVLLEQHAGHLPAWLAPEQVAVLPVSPEQQSWAEEVAAQLSSVGVRAAVADAETSLGRRIALAHESGVPYVAVLGAREANARSVTLRRNGEQRTLALSSAVADLIEQCRLPPFGVQTRLAA